MTSINTNNPPSRLRQRWIFFRQWLKSPLATASVAPSSAILAGQMAAQLLPSDHLVVELGGGTGVITSAILNHGIQPDNLLVVELNDELATALAEQFKGVTIFAGDARELERVLTVHPTIHPGQVDAIVSGLGFLTMPETIAHGILQTCFAMLKPTGRLIQFTYGPKCPVPERSMRELSLSAKKVGFVVRNFPPASIYVIARQ
jgi:phosphatidylethanolamine/phosphatidyl-N-methylethanolamine N-methyltransferase